MTDVPELDALELVVPDDDDEDDDDDDDDDDDVDDALELLEPPLLVELALLELALGPGTVAAPASLVLVLVPCSVESGPEPSVPLHATTETTALTKTNEWN